MRSTYTRRHLLQLAGLGAVGIAGAAACAPSASDDDDGGSSASPDSKPRDFTFASWELADDVFKGSVTAMTESFASSNDIKIEPVAWDYGDYLSQLTLQLRGGELSGAAHLDINWLGAIASLGKLKDLSSFAEGPGYTEAALLSGQFQGIQYGLPWTTGAIGLVANRELLDKAGITEFPTNVEDFEAALKELKTAKTIPYAGMTKVDNLKDILMWMETFGSPIVDGDQVTIGDDASIEAIAWYKSLYDQKLIAADVNRDDARTLFAQGRAAMYDDAVVAKGILLSATPDKNFESKLEPVARPVVNDGDDPRAMLWGHIVVVVDDEAGDTAAEFTQWLTSDEATVIDYFTEFALPPTTEAALASEEVGSDTFVSTFSERITATATPSKFSVFPQYAQMEAVLAEQVQAALVGDASPADAMTAAGEEIQSLM